MPPAFKRWFVVFGLAWYAAGCAGEVECGRVACVRTLMGDAGRPRDVPARDAGNGDDDLGGFPDAAAPDADTDASASDASADAALPTDAELCGNTAGAVRQQVDAVNRRCYIVWGVAPSGSVARRSCAEKGGQLATITSAEEDALLKGLLMASGRTYIGIFRSKAGDTPKWVTGEPMTYKNWAANEPGTDDQLCGIYDPAGAEPGWHDFPCDTAKPYVCERSASAPTPPPLPPPP